jgi:hypothetical protein
VAAEAGWPVLALERRRGLRAEAHESLDDERATLLLQNGGSIEIARDPPSACFTVPHELRDEEITHPLLAPVAAVVNRWYGREAFHAGGFVADGRVFGVIGDRASGKSSLLAWLALQGWPVLCDDVLVADAEDAFAGPRCVDLREDAAAHLGAGNWLGRVGARERWRLALDGIPARAPLAGWVFLEWSSTLAVERTAVAERLLRLGANRSVNRPPVDAVVMLRLSALPGWTVRRPRDWACLAPAAQRLLDEVT